MDPPLTTPCNDSNATQAPVIAVIGPTGTGKSTFIKIATGFDDIQIGENLSSRTQPSRVIRCQNPRRGREVLFVDTPGFVDTVRNEDDILQGITDWLEKTYISGITLSGILYLHRITDNRTTKTALRNLNVFRKICGGDALSKIRLVTTNWDLLSDKKVGERIEQELCKGYWKPLIAKGAQVHRFQSTAASAWDIVNSLPLERETPPSPHGLTDQSRERPLMDRKPFFRVARTFHSIGESLAKKVMPAHALNISLESKKSQVSEHQLHFGDNASPNTLDELNTPEPPSFCGAVHIRLFPVNLDTVFDAATSPPCDAINIEDVTRELKLAHSRSAVSSPMLRLTSVASRLAESSESIDSLKTDQSFLLLLKNISGLVTAALAREAVFTQLGVNAATEAFRREISTMLEITRQISAAWSQRGQQQLSSRHIIQQAILDVNIAMQDLLTVFSPELSSKTPAFNQNENTGAHLARIEANVTHMIETIGS